MRGIEPRLTRNQLHRQRHPGERLAGTQYGLLWALAALVCALGFLALFPQTDTSGGMVLLVVVIFVTFTGLWAVFARRHPEAAMLIGILCAADAERTKHKMDARRAADHAAYLDAQRQAREDRRAGIPPDYSGPAGFGRY